MAKGLERSPTGGCAASFNVLMNGLEIGAQSFLSKYAESLNVGREGQKNSERSRSIGKLLLATAGRSSVQTAG